MKNQYFLAIIGLICTACAAPLVSYIPKNPEQEIEKIKINILDSYQRYEILGICVRIENETSEILEIDPAKASIILDSGESTPAYIADETRNIVVRNYNLYDYFLWAGGYLKTRKILEKGPMPPSSWREGVAFFCCFRMANEL